MSSINTLKSFIELFLVLNPEPADAQVHALAAALGCDKEALESVMYKMLADTSKYKEWSAQASSLICGTCHEVNCGCEVLSSTEEVLQGELNDDTMDPNELAMNDGTINIDSDDDDGTDDGIAEVDEGIGGAQGTEGDPATNDGIVEIKA